MYKPGFLKRDTCLPLEATKQFSGGHDPSLVALLWYCITQVSQHIKYSPEKGATAHESLRTTGTHFQEEKVIAGIQLQLDLYLYIDRYLIWKFCSIQIRRPGVEVLIEKMIWN